MSYICCCKSAGQYRNMTEDDGTGIGRSQLTVTLGRGDLGAKLECSGKTSIYICI